jgi:hypothetical protein
LPFNVDALAPGALSLGFAGALSPKTYHASAPPAPSTTTTNAMSNHRRG